MTPLKMSASQERQLSTYRLLYDVASELMEDGRVVATYVTAAGRDWSLIERSGRVRALASPPSGCSLGESGGSQ